jgi:hypothetical protein
LDKTSVGACLSVVFVGLAQSVHADAPKIENVTLVGTQLSVTLSHPDTGWDHYADRWLVFDLSGKTDRGTRALAPACDRAAICALKRIA